MYCFVNYTVDIKILIMKYYTIPLKKILRRFILTLMPRSNWEIFKLF